MTMQIAIIDPFVKTPAVHCFNNLVQSLKVPLTYHMPSTLGIQSLIEAAPITQAYIILGSASHVTENLAWHEPLAQFLLNELKAKKPVLGCCFGHQLMCHALGSEVSFYYPDEEKLSGQRKIVLTKDFWDFNEGEIFHLAVTHRQIVKSLGPELMNVGVGLPNDIVIHKSLPFMGTQAHPEVSGYFCQEDIKDLNANETEQAQRDGIRFIRRFLEHFKVIETTLHN